MTQRIFNLDRWKRLAPGNLLEFPDTAAGDPRLVRLDVRCPVKAHFAVVQPNVEGKPDIVGYLGVVEGADTFEFAATGPVWVVATADEDVWYFSDAVDEATAVENVHAVSFTTIASRRARNPDLELMMFIAEQNMNRRLEAQQGQIDAMMEAARATALAAGANPDTGEIDEPETAGPETGGSAGTTPAVEGDEQGAPAGASEPPAKKAAGAK